MDGILGALMQLTEKVTVLQVDAQTSGNAINAQAAQLDRLNKKLIEQSDEIEVLRTRIVNLESPPTPESE